MTNKLPPKVSDCKCLKIMHDQAEDFLRKIAESEASSSLPSNLESVRLNASSDITASDGDHAKPQEQKLEDNEDAAGIDSSQDGGKVQEGNGSSISTRGAAGPPQSSDHGSGSPNSSRPRKERETETIEHFAPNVYVTLIVRPGGYKIFKRVRFSKRRFDEHQAEEWWSKNKDKVLRKCSPSATNLAATAPPSTRTPPPPPFEENVESSPS